MVRRLGGCELFERLIAGERRPPLGLCRASPRTMPRSWTTTSGPISSVCFSSERAACPCNRTRSDRPRSAYNASATSACMYRCPFAAPTRRRPGAAARVAASSVSTTSDSGSPIMSTSTSSEKSMPSTDAAVKYSRRIVRSGATGFTMTSCRLGGTSSALVGRESDSLTRIVQAARLHPVPDELRCVERVAGGFTRNAAATRGPLSASPATGVATDTRSANSSSSKPAELQTTMLAPFEIGERGPQLFRRVLARFAATGNKKDRCVGQRGRRDATSTTQSAQPTGGRRASARARRASRPDGGDHSRPRTRGIVRWRRRTPSGPEQSMRVAS